MKQDKYVDAGGYMIHSQLSLDESLTIGPYALIGQEPRTFSEELFLDIGTNSVINSHAILYAQNRIGKNFFLGHHALIREANIIGDDVSVGSYSNIEHHVEIEDGVRIHSNVFIPEYSYLAKGCWIGPRVTFTNAPFPLGSHVKQRLEGPSIGEGAIIGANSTILPGVKVGKNSFVAAGSLVTKDVPDNYLVMGSPAQPVKAVSELMYGDGVRAYSKR